MAGVIIVAQHQGLHFLHCFCLSVTFYLFSFLDQTKMFPRIKNFKTGVSGVSQAQRIMGVHGPMVTVTPSAAEINLLLVRAVI